MLVDANNTAGSVFGFLLTVTELANMTDIAVARQEIGWAVRWRRFGGRLAGAGTFGAGTARQA